MLQANVVLQGYERALVMQRHGDLCFGYWKQLALCFAVLLAYCNTKNCLQVLQAVRNNRREEYAKIINTSIWRYSQTCRAINPHSHFYVHHHGTTNHAHACTGYAASIAVI